METACVCADVAGELICVERFFAGMSEHESKIYVSSGIQPG